MQQVRALPLQSLTPDQVLEAIRRIKAHVDAAHNPYVMQLLA